MTELAATLSELRLQRVVSPPRDQLEHLRTPLEPGERLVFELFDRALGTDWEIYVQPHLNNLRPDIVLLHARASVAVFEVKDWRLHAHDWRIEFRNGRAVLVGTDENRCRFVRPNPFERLHQYRTEIADLYCPELNRAAGLAAVTAGLVFPFIEDDELVERFGAGLSHRARDAAARHYLTLSGASTVRDGSLDAIFPDHVRRSSRFMTPKVAADLRHWLVEPDVSAEQREEPRLSRDQRRYVDGRLPVCGGFAAPRVPARRSWSQPARRLSREKTRMF